MFVDVEGETQLAENNSLTVMFLNLDLKRIRTGVENAALLRATMFERHLGIVPQFLTVNYHPYFAEVHAELRVAGLVSELLVFRNMYDFFQEADWSDSSENSAKASGARASALGESGPPTGAGWRCVKVAKTPDTRVYDETNQVILYRKRSRQTGVLEYVNYFHRKKKWRRDSYATGGWLSRMQFLDGETEEPLYEHYLRPDGSLALIQWFTGRGKERQLTKAQLFSRDGYCVREWRDQAGMVTHVPALEK